MRARGDTVQDEWCLGRWSFPRRWFRVDGAGRPGDPDLVVARSPRKGGRQVVEWGGTVVLTTPRLLLRTFPATDHEAEIEDMGMVFQAVVYVITGEQWRSGAATRRRGVR
jgi:hypothetical protein